MKRALRLAALLLTVVVVAAAACFLTGRLLSHRPAPGTGQGADTAHQWVHRELKLTSEQDQSLHPIEQRYAARRDELKAATPQNHAGLRDPLRARAHSVVACDTERVGRDEAHRHTDDREHRHERHFGTVALSRHLRAMETPCVAGAAQNLSCTRKDRIVST